MSGAARKFVLPGPLGKLGKKHMEQLSNWSGTAATFGTAAGLGVLYFTDWKVVLQYLPFYNTKFKPDETE